MRWEVTKATNEINGDVPVITKQRGFALWKDATNRIATQIRICVSSRTGGINQPLSQNSASLKRTISSLILPMPFQRSRLDLRGFDIGVTLAIGDAW